MSGAHCHTCTSSLSGCALCTSLYRTIESTAEQYLYFKSRLSKSKCKSSSDVAGSAKKCQELESQGKDKERQEEKVTEELKSDLKVINSILTLETKLKELEKIIKSFQECRNNVTTELK